MLANIRNTKIFFDIAGMQVVPGKKGVITRPVLFLLHGGPGGDHLRYKQHSLELQEVAQLVFIDHRGCGRSQKAKPQDYTLENNIEDIEALRQHLGFDRICILGTSYGGVVAQGYALRYPKNLDKLILVATAPSYRFKSEAKAFLQQHATPEQIKFSEHLWQGTFKSAAHAEKFFAVMDNLYSVKAKKNRSKKVTTNVKPTWCYQALNKGFSDILSRFDFIPKLKKIKCRTLVLAGKEDWICSDKQSKVIAQHIPNAQLKIFKHSSHAIAIDAHDQYIKSIKKFLQQSNH